MIIKFKIFENIYQGEPKVGDYVIVSDKFDYYSDYSSDYSEYLNFINNNIGKIIDIRDDIYPYVVNFNNIPKNLKKYFEIFENDDKICYAKFKRDEIIHYSDTISVLEPYIAANKYNL